ncbi:MAG TPA: penicillin acylase family protein [Steroidobacteraceae bacterium]|nr:penicillin acylase family protein [Steroidobacteraceae bacterium]
MRKTTTILLAGLLMQASAVALAADTLAADTLAADSLTARAQAALADSRGASRAPGLHHVVRVQRDKWGVAHIYASDSLDLFFAQGFVAAQDRLFQMEMWKRAGQGRLAEILGPSAVERDAQARRLRYRGDLKAEYASYAPDTLEILRAFTDGINAYIKALQAPGGRGLPLEFQIAGFAPEPWQPTDCLNRLAAYSMMNNASGELLHAQLVALLGAAEATKLFTFEPHAQLTPAPGVDFSGLSPALLANVVSSDQRIPFPASSLQESNNWTVSGSMTATGKPILANDPHRVIAEPSLRYIVHLVAPGWNVIGAGEPALPGVAAGHNEQIAWGFTIFGLDQQDLYLETLDPAQPDRYETPSGWRTMTVSSETIAVRGGAPVTVSLKYTRHGPVLWEDGKRALALRWVGAEPGTAGYLGSLSLDRARNWKEFEEAMPRWKVPSENIVYADRNGNIGEHSTGLAPHRVSFNGLLPVPGNGHYEWQGFLRNADLPHHFNPAEQFIATANHKMIPDDYAFAVGFEWAPPTRFQRIHDVLEEARRTGHKVTVDDMGALQSDVVSLIARRLQPLLQAALAAQGDSVAASTRAAADLLLHWDGALREDSAPAVLFELWTPELTRLVMDRVVPGAARQVVPPWPTAKVVSVLATLGDGRDLILLQALTAARERLETLQGSDPAKWTWGALHEVYFRHALDAAPGAAALFDRGPFPRSGDGDVVQATSVDRKTFEQVAGASYREVFDLSNWDHSLAVNVPGQSGQPGSPHYDDLLPLWRAGRFFELAYSREAVDAVTTDTLELRP